MPLSSSPGSSVSSTFTAAGLDRPASMGASPPKTNQQWAKDQGIRDVAFAKKRGLKVHKVERSSWVYRQLRRFRARIEGCISMLKRVLGLRRCTWKGWAHFQRYVALSIISFNLLVLARLLLSPQP